jgi:predicted amidohydrolase
VIFTVALLQIAPSGNDQNRNLAKGLQCCREAKSAGADLAVFPELWNIGCAPCPIDETGRRLWAASAIDFRSEFFEAFAELAKELSMNIALTYLEAHQPKPRNTVSIINKEGKVVLNYSKVFICNFGSEELMKSEPNVSEIGCDVNCDPGDSFDVCTLKNGGGEVNVGAMICADREFPEAATQLMLNGAELIVIPNSCTWDDIRTAGLRTRAFENLVGVAMANYPGPRAGSSQGHTCVTWTETSEPQDTLISRAGDGQQVLLAPFNLDHIRAFRRAESWRLDYRRRGNPWRAR